jgi:flagellar hook-associated protein 3 FlgL
MSYFRVSTANSYDATVNRIAQRSLELSETQEKLSSGKRVLRATDDPVAATLAERESNRLQRAQADLRALERSRAALEQTEDTVSQAVTVMHRIKELVVQGGNATLSTVDRQSILQEIRGLREQLLNLANAQDSEGNSLLGGLGVTNTLGKPFADVYGNDPSGNSMSGVQFQGVAGQAAATETGLPSRADGNFALMRNLTGNGIFSVEHASGDLLVKDGGVVDMTAYAAGIFGTAVMPENRYQFRVLDDGNDPATLSLEISQTDAGGTSVVDTLDLGQSTDGNGVELNNLSVQFQGMQITLNGRAKTGDAFALAPSQPGDVFATVQRAIDALGAELDPASNPNPSARRSQELARVHDEMDTALDKMLLVQGRMGEMLRRSDTIEAQLETRSVDHEKALSDLTDLDMVKGISQFQSQQLGLQAALQSYGQIQKLSLFQYIA